MRQHLRFEAWIRRALGVAVIMGVVAIVTGGYGSAHKVFCRKNGEGRLSAFP
jgi:hypothetical protein